MNGSHDPRRQPSPAGGMSMALMMGLMMSVCVLVFATFVLIPVLGWALGIAIGVIGAAAMLWAHQRFMGHGGHE